MASITTGTTVTFSSGFLGALLSLSRSGLTRAVLPRSHFGTTTAHVNAPADLHEPGQLSGTMQFDPATKPPINGAAETVTITFPNADTWAASGYLTDFDVSGNLEEDFEASFTIQLSGDTTVVDNP